LLVKPTRGVNDRIDLFSLFEYQTYIKWLPGWLVKSQLVIHSPESEIEYFILTRVENSEMMGVAYEDSPEEPQRQESIVVGCAGESFWGVGVCEKGHPGEFK
jgi:hypothetical protein